MKRTLAYQLWKRQLVILVHSKSSPSEGEWDDYCKAVKGWCKEIRGVLVVSEGGGPNSMQRAQLEEALDRDRFSGKTAVVTLSSIARGIVTAMSWFNPNIKAFSTIQIPAALDYLGVPKDDRDEVQKEIQALRAKAQLVDG